MFCDTNSAVDLIWLSTGNVLLALILKSVVGPRRIHFIKVRKSGDVKKSPSNCQFEFENVPYLLG